MTTDPTTLIHLSFVRVTGATTCTARGSLRIGKTRVGQELEFTTVDGAHHRLRVVKARSGPRIEELELEGEGVGNLVPGVFLCGFESIAG